ncbi:hypothetical protein ACFL43_03435, partial [Thermodesulfobacteriota bacterium]
YEQAYQLFSPLITEKYPVALMQKIHENIYSRLGTPASYSYKGRGLIDQDVVRAMPSASKSYLYDVVFKKNGQEKIVPLLITFDGGKNATRLLSHRFMAEGPPSGKKD